MITSSSLILLHTDNYASAFTSCFVPFSFPASRFTSPFVSFPPASFLLCFCRLFYRRLNHLSDWILRDLLRRRDYSKNSILVTKDLFAIDEFSTRIFECLIPRKDKLGVNHGIPTKWPRCHDLSRFFTALWRPRHRTMWELAAGGHWGEPHVTSSF